MFINRTIISYFLSLEPFFSRASSRISRNFTLSEWSIRRLSGFPKHSFIIGSVYLEGNHYNPLKKILLQNKMYLVFIFKRSVRLSRRRVTQASPSINWGDYNSRIHNLASLAILFPFPAFQWRIKHLNSRKCMKVSMRYGIARNVPSRRRASPSLTESGAPD